jgi:hypothetical protein
MIRHRGEVDDAEDEEWFEHGEAIQQTKDLVVSGVDNYECEE